MMKVLPITFILLTVCGFWRPIDFESFFKRHFYNCFSFFICCAIYSFTFSHLLDILVNSQDFEELTKSCFMLLSMMNVCCKMTNILYFRSDILGLLNILDSDQCKPRNKVEEQLLNKFHKRARVVTLCYAILTETTCMLITARTFFASARNILPFRAWIPYEITSRFIYWMTFAHQTIAHVVAANMQIANETLICGLMIQACSQLELLKYRLKEIPKIIQEIGFVEKTEDTAKRLLVNCIQHHRRIIEYSERLNNAFNVTIFVQFLISTLVLCSSVYIMSKMNMMSVQFMSLTLYLFCMMFQIFLFCWYGNEVILRSIDVGNAVYFMDWTVFNTKERKSLPTIMLLVRKPIKFTSSFLVTLSIDSFCKILKTSYSVFNLLQRTSV